MLALAAGGVSTAVALILIWTGGHTPRLQWTLTIFIAAAWLGFAFTAEQRVIFPMRTLSNLLAALREGDFSIRARGASRDDVLGEVLREVNALGDTLHRQRLGALEATTLLRKVMEEIDVAVFAFDGDSRLRLVNRAGERLLNRPAVRLLGHTADQLDLAGCLSMKESSIESIAFPGKSGRWEIRRGSFREGGLIHQLLVISDLSAALREEERQAWQRLIRVLGHELNNSLAPIKSVAENLASTLKRPTRAHDWEEDMERGLTVIATRSDSLGRFMSAYSRLAKLPPPSVRPTEVGAWIRRVAGLESRIPIKVSAGAGTSHRGGCRPARSTAHQFSAQCGGCVAGDGWRRDRGLECRGALCGCLGARRGAGDTQSRELVRPFLHHQAERLGNWPGAQPADRRSASRIADLRKLRGWARVRSACETPPHKLA